MGLFEGLLPSFLISFREALEAALIVTIIIAYLKKIGKSRLSWYAYIGSGTAIAFSIILGLLIQTFYGGLSKVASEVFEGVASLTAVIVLTYMIFWMTEHSKNIKDELQERIDVSITEGELYSIASLAFVAVAREGLESVLFLSSTFFQDSTGTLIGAFTGIMLVLFLSFALMKGAYRLDLGRFFKYTSLLLVIFAAGLAGYGVHELIEASERSGIEFGVLGESAWDINPQVNPDGSYPWFHEKGIVGSILKALVGYDGNPEWLRVIIYLGYWIVIGIYLLRNYRK